MGPMLLLCPAFEFCVGRRGRGRPRHTSLGVFQNGKTTDDCKKAREIATKGRSSLCAGLWHCRRERRQGPAFVDLGREKNEPMPDVLVGYDSRESGSSACNAGMGNVAR